MHDKPVAWITPDNLKILENEYGEEVLVRNQDHYTYEIPLYTHPVKELTDEEIKANTITEVLNYFEEARYELEADFVFKLKKHFQIFGEEE